MQLSRRRLIFATSEDAPTPGSLSGELGYGMVPRGGDFIRLAADTSVLPQWLSQADLDHVAGEFARTGFRGALKWYRNMDRNWELLALWGDAKVEVPALYMAGDRDLLLKAPLVAHVIENLKHFVPKLTNTSLLPGCGHWTQQECSAEVSSAIMRSCANSADYARVAAAAVALGITRAHRGLVCYLRKLRALSEPAREE